MFRKLLLSATVGCAVAFSPFSSSKDALGLRERSSTKLHAVKNFDALLFDCDGVLAETERDVHRVAFNKAFKEKGYDIEWSTELYGDLLTTAGGKERMTRYFNENNNWPAEAGTTDESKKEFILMMQNMKIENFKKTVEAGEVGLRPGVKRLIDDAFDQGLKVAVCSTTSPAQLESIIKNLLGDEYLEKVPQYTGDIVPNKKPAPDIYNFGANSLGVDPKRCWVVEDTEIGLRAAKAAGMRCVVTKSVYTENENFAPHNPEAVIKDLDNGPDGPITVDWLDEKLGLLSD